MTQIFVKYILHLCIFRHLKLEIALAIPASNDEKENPYTSISGSWHAPRPGSQRVKMLTSKTTMSHIKMLASVTNMIHINIRTLYFRISTSLPDSV